MKETERNGELETHLTIALNGVADLRRLQQWAELNNMKCLHIVLDRGENVSQPMLTRRVKGELSAEVERAKEVRERLKAEGFQVTRIKIEATGLNQDAAETETLSGHRYFEHHIKLLLEPASDIESLSRLVEPHSAHLSRNVLKKGSDGRQERFVTQRCLTVDKIVASERLRALLSMLSSLNLSILKVDEELVVYDSNLELDNGWIVT